MNVMGGLESFWTGMPVVGGGINDWHKRLWAQRMIGSDKRHLVGYRTLEVLVIGQLGMYVNRAGSRADEFGMETLATLAQPVVEETEDGSERRRTHRQTLVMDGLLYRDNRAAGPQRVKIKN